MRAPISQALRRYWLLGAIALALVAGFALRVDLLDSGFYADDFDHHAMQVGRYPVARSRWDMFSFSDGTPAEARTLMQSGHFPWWSAPDIHLSMLRPLSSALISFDFAAFGTNARLFHWHSFAWWAALVVAAALVLARLLPPPLAAFALLLFAIEEGHALPVGWLANRSTLVATAFGCFALHGHLAWRREGSIHVGARIASLACVALSLCAGEYAFGALAYIVAFELCARQDAWSTRARALAPIVGMALVYLTLRQALGFGIQGSGFYISVTAAPLAFLTALLWRVPVLSAELAFGIPADWYTSGSPWRDTLLRTGWFSRATWHALPDWTSWHTAIGVVALLAVLWLLATLPRLVGHEVARSLRGLGLGALLSLLPAAGGMVSPRLTVAASLGFDALIATLVFHAFLTAQRAGRWWAAGRGVIACTLLLYVHVYAASARASADASWMRYRSQLEQAWVLSAEVDESVIASQEIFVLAAQDVTSASYLPYVRQMYGGTMPRSCTLLSGASQPHDLVRVADNAFELFVISNNVDLMAVGGNYRPSDQPFHVGDTVTLPGMQVRVLRTLRGQPQAVRVTLPSSLDAPRYLFLESSERGLRRLALPAVGEQIRIKRPVYPNEASLDLLMQDRKAGTFGAIHAR